METINLQQEATHQTTVEKKAVTIPLYLYATVLASISIMVGLVWDISWHTSIGRDGLLSPPHIAIYFGGVLAGIFSGIKVLKITFAGSPQEKEESNKFWGIFYGSLGALFCIWGAIAMLTSAPFDDWWHNTYGLDVTILSPPHTVLLMGMIFIQFGAMITVLAVKNRMKAKNIQDEGMRKELSVHFALASGFVIAMLFTIASEYLGKHDMHNTTFYIVASFIFPLIMVAVSRSAPNKWGATSAAIVYTIFLMLMVWILPLFPAEPLLGPVLNPITHFQAFEFPLLIIFPAIGIDLITQKMGDKNKWLLSLIYAAVFLAVLMVVQWPFGNFLMSDAARNWVFGTESWYFGSSPDWEYRYAYAEWMESSGIELVKGIAIALGIGFLVSRLSIRWGRWMQNIIR
jgi:hypothetical protein